MLRLLINKATETETTSIPANQIVSHMIVYPNPITAESFKLNFELKQQTPISIRIYELNGILKAQQQLSTNGTGMQELMIPFSAPIGNYILNLYYKDQVIKTILIKK